MDIKDFDLDDDILVTKAIMHLEDEEQGIFKDEIVGEWDIDDLVQAKSFLNKLIDNKIQDKLSTAEEKELRLINMKHQEYDAEFLNSLSPKQQKLYYLVNPEVEWIDITELTDKEAEELMVQFDRLMDENEEAENGVKHDLEKFVKDLEAEEAAKNDNNKVINLEDYR
ncbi:MAG: hypothetical protein R6V17_07460 [Halanaerobacter sp.]